MPATPISLAQVRVANPCPKSWDELAGDGATRFCDHCKLHVHNLSAMPADAAQRLICESAGRLCVAYVPDARGGVTPLEYAKRKSPRYGWKLVAALAGFGGFASTIATSVYRPKPVAVPMVMGDMAPVTVTHAPVCSDVSPVSGPGAP
jgi:hypothetical protein